MKITYFNNDKKIYWERKVSFIEDKPTYFKDIGLYQSIENYIKDEGFDEPSVDNRDLLPYFRLDIEKNYCLLKYLGSNFFIDEFCRLFYFKGYCRVLVLNHLYFVNFIEKELSMDSN